MVAPIPALGPRTPVSVNLQFTRGRHGAAARIELHDRPSGRVALLELRGWIDLSAEQRLEQTLDELAARGVARLVVDCSPLRHVDYRMVPRLVGALARFETRSGSVLLSGLSRHLRDLFRLAGFDPHVGAWSPDGQALPAPGAADGVSGGRAS
jgi:anti-anti-sigma factor